MKKCFSVVILIFSALLLSSCALVPEKIKLEPNVGEVHTSNIGHGKKVAVRIIDDRPSASIGGRPSGYGPAANISIANDISTVVQETVYKGLNGYGFKPVAYQTNAPRKLTLHIIALQYKQRVGFFTGGINISSVIDGSAINKSQSYDRVYRGKKDVRIVVTPTESQDADNINQALSNTLREIVTDKKLMHFLAK